MLNTNKMANHNIAELKNLCTQVRRDIVRMTHGVGSGHPGGAMGCTEYFVALYQTVMTHDNSFNSDALDEDLCLLSNGHICAVWYSVLARSGYFEASELATHRKINSRLQGHPSPAKNLPGIRMASGSLGQGLSVAVGSALAKKLNGEDKHVFVLMGDGEQQEGQVWEAGMFAAHHKVDNLIATIDLNGAQIDGMTDDILSLMDLEAKWKAFGWDVMIVEEGNDIQTVINALEEAKSRTGKGKPVMILLKTLMGYGVDFMQGGNAWHGKAPSDEQLEKALEQLTSNLADY